MDLVAEYLNRIAHPRPGRADPASLRSLHAAHLERVPFENLDVGLGVDSSLDPDALADKIITRRRGGFCYELNGLFARLLSELGYRVTLLGARVGSGPPLDHLALLVGCVDGSRWLADVGFGAHSRYPLAFETGTDQADPDGMFRLDTVEDGDLSVSMNGRVQYRVDRHPRQLDDFRAMCWYQQHSPASHFTRNTICSLPISGGRATLREDVLTITDGDGKHERRLADDTAVLAAYREHFGFELATAPRIETR